MTFHCNKPLSSLRKTGQKSYANIFNYIEAANNDGCCDIHKATYSTELCYKLLDIYGGGICYDPFMGTGTTAIACYKKKMRWIGSELSPLYCEYANERIKNETVQQLLF
jgi:DNA modification methylase